MLLGGKTRFLVLEKLAETKQSMTAYHIALTKGLDPAAIYRCLTEFLEFGIVEAEMKERGQTFYRLSGKVGNTAAEFLSLLKQKTSESIDLEEWISPEMQAERRAKIIRLDKINQFNISPDNKKLDERKDIEQVMSKRVSGELSALVASSQIAFNELFERKDDRTFVLRG